MHNKQVNDHDLGFETLADEYVPQNPSKGNPKFMQEKKEKDKNPPDTSSALNPINVESNTIRGVAEDDEQVGTHRGEVDTN